MTAQAREIIWEVALRRNVSPSKIISSCRLRRVYRARIEVAQRLHERGYSSSRIGAVLNHDHTTVLYYLGRFKNKPSPEVVRWRRPRIKYLTLVKTLPPDEPPTRFVKLYMVPYAGADPDDRWKERPRAST